MLRGLLTRTDEKIVATICRYRYMTLEDVCFLFFAPGALTHVRSLLAKLSGGDFTTDNYLYRFFLPEGRPGSPTRVYTLGRRGRDYCRDALGLPADWYFNPSKGSVAGHLYLQHALALTKALVAATVWGQRQDTYELTEVRPSYELSRLKQMKEEATAIPDAWLLFLQGARKFPVMLEIDLGTENINKFKQHIAARIGFIRSGKYEEVFGLKAVRIAYLAIGSGERRDALWQWTRKALKDTGRADWGQIFMFAAIDWREIYTLSWLHDRIWIKASSSDRDFLFD